jgi:hypothetical protein
MNQFHRTFIIVFTNKLPVIEYTVNDFVIKQLLVGCCSLKKLIFAFAKKTQNI